MLLLLTSRKCDGVGSKKAFNVRHREADSTRNPTAPSSDRPPSVDPSTKNRVAVPQNRLTRKTWTPNASNHCGGGVIARRRRRTAAGSRGWLSSCQNLVMSASAMLTLTLAVCCVASSSPSDAPGPASDGRNGGGGDLEVVFDGSPELPPRPPPMGGDEYEDNGENDVRRKRYSVNYVLGPEDGTTGQKRFSMNYQDFIQGDSYGQDSARGNDDSGRHEARKRYYVRYFGNGRRNRQHEKQDGGGQLHGDSYLDAIDSLWKLDPISDDGEDEEEYLRYLLMHADRAAEPTMNERKRFSMNYRDFLDASGRAPAEDSRDGGGGGVAARKRFSMNYRDFIASAPQSEKEARSSPQKKKRKRKRLTLATLAKSPEGKRFTMNFQDTIDNREAGFISNSGANFGLYYYWKNKITEKPERTTLRVVHRRTTTAATTTTSAQDTKRAPPSPPTASALGTPSLRRRPSAKSVESARNILRTLDHLFSEVSRRRDFDRAVCGNAVMLRLLRIREYLIRTTVPDYERPWERPREWQCD